MRYWWVVAGLTLSACSSSVSGDASNDGVATDNDRNVGDDGPSDNDVAMGDADVDSGDVAGDEDAGDGGPTFDFDADPPDLGCLDDGSLSATELAIAGMAENSWMELPHTDFQTFCNSYEDPSVHAVEGCSAVIADWSGGIFDDGHHELVLFGGGHGGYYGNEVVAFSTNTGQWRVVRAATATPNGIPDLSEPMADGTPVSRHTYSGLAYMGDIRAMFAFGGASAPNGYSVNSTWRFDLDGATWTKLNDGPGSSVGHYFLATAYDPVANHVYMRDEMGIWDYDAIADSWQHVIDFGYAPYYPLWTTYDYRSAVMVSGLFIAAGGFIDGGAPDIIWYDPATQQDVTADYPSTGDFSAFMHAGAGLAYSTRDEALVAWSGGGPGVMSMADRVWQTASNTGAPVTQVNAGTYGRWRYVAYLNAFILVNQPGENVYVYKLTAGCGAD